jgi:hypothetical protein
MKQYIKHMEVTQHYFSELFEEVGEAKQILEVKSSEAADTIE